MDDWPLTSGAPKLTIVSIVGLIPCDECADAGFESREESAHDIGIEQWDQEGEPLHDPEALEAFVDEMRRAVRPPAEFHEIDGHINGEEFVSTALSIFDRWVADGYIVPGRPEEAAR